MLGDAVGDTEGAWVPVRIWACFTVAVPNVIYAATMDSDPGWTVPRSVAIRRAELSAGTGPSGGLHGTNIGLQFGGNYANRLSMVYATTGPIDCSKYTQLTLKFRRWLRLRSGDSAVIQVSTDGTAWTTFGRR